MREREEEEKREGQGVLEREKRNVPAGKWDLNLIENGFKERGLGCFRERNKSLLLEDEGDESK